MADDLGLDPLCGPAGFDSLIAATTYSQVAQAVLF